MTTTTSNVDVSERGAIPAKNSTVQVQLQPVRRALLDDATHDAEQIAGRASQRAADVVDSARRESATQLEQVRRRRERSAEAHAEQMLAMAHNNAHEAILRAREVVRRQLIDETRRSVMAVRNDERYDTLLDRLEDLARAQLGADARIDRDPAPDGGVIATNGSRRVDYTLPALADRALEALADEVALLWE
jgi:vacuolar-type H+-ATPase subunit E/Vma4